MKTHADFIEELKEYIDIALMEAISIQTSAAYELDKILKLIEQFEEQLLESV